MKNKYYLHIFFVIAMSYAFFGLCYLLDNFGLLIQYMFLPLICTIIYAKLIHNKTSLNISFKVNYWTFFALLTPVFIFVGGIFVALLFSGVTLALEYNAAISYILKNLPIALIAGISINAMFAFGEEFCWRGFLLNSLKEMSFVKATLIIGVAWGIWHAPLILQGHNYPDHPQSGVFLMILHCILWSFILNYITIKSGSLVAASVVHGTWNAIGGGNLILLKGGNDIIVGAAGIADFVVLAIFIILLYFYDKLIARDNIMQRKISDTIKIEWMRHE